MRVAGGADRRVRIGQNRPGRVHVARHQGPSPIRQNGSHDALFPLPRALRSRIRLLVHRDVAVVSDDRTPGLASRDQEHARTMTLKNTPPIEISLPPITTHLPGMRLHSQRRVSLLFRRGSFRRTCAVRADRCKDEAVVGVVLEAVDEVVGKRDLRYVRRHPGAHADRRELRAGGVVVDAVDRGPWPGPPGSRAWVTRVLRPARAR